jgi:hypothetical protein
MDWLEDRSSPTPNNCTRASMRGFFSTRLNLKASPEPLIALSRTRSATATQVVQPLLLMSSFKLLPSHVHLSRCGISSGLGSLAHSKLPFPPSALLSKLQRWPLFSDVHHRMVYQAYPRLRRQALADRVWNRNALAHCKFTDWPLLDNHAVWRYFVECVISFDQLLNSFRYSQFPHIRSDWPLLSTSAAPLL